MGSDLSGSNEYGISTTGSVCYCFSPEAQRRWDRSKQRTVCAMYRRRTPQLFWAIFRQIMFKYILVIKINLTVIANNV